MSRVEWTTLSGEEVEAVVAMLINREHPLSARVTPSQGDGGVDFYTATMMERGVTLFIKFIPLAGSRSVVAFTAAQIPDAVILTMVNPGSEHGEWKGWGLSQGFVPTGP